MKPRKLPNGRWRADVKHAGRRRTITADTAAEARTKAAEVLLELGGTPAGRVTVGELVEAHLAAVVAELAPGTYDNYRRCATRLPDEFTSRPAAGVTPLVIDALYRQLQRDGAPSSQLEKTHTLLGVAWQRAIRYGWTTRNPVRDVRTPKQVSPEVRPPMPADLAAVLEHATPQFRLFLRVAASLGARRGELAALRWDDVDLDTGRVVIRRALAYSPRTGVVVRDTKTGRKGHRVVTVGSSTLADLRRHRAGLVESALARGLPAPVHVFSDDAGVTPWFPTSPTKMMRTARETASAAALKAVEEEPADSPLRDDARAFAARAVEIRLKNVRHYVATQMLAAGESVAQVAGRLGHSTPATTMRVYAHWIPANDQDTADRMDRLLERGSG